MPRSDNIYATAEGPNDNWIAAETTRLGSMDELLTLVTTTDLVPVLDRYTQVDRLLDIGAGTGSTTESLCQARGIGYFALDISESFLDARSTPRSHMMLARSEQLPVLDNSFAVTYSRAVTAWNAEPTKAISEQLRVTRLGGTALFTEFDWRTSTAAKESDAVAAIMGVKAVAEMALTRGGFKTEYGAELGADIDKVIGVQAVDTVMYERTEARHNLPEGDYRALFLEAADNVLLQLQKIDRGSARTYAEMLEGYIEKIQEAERCILRLPTLITHEVLVHA